MESLLPQHKTFVELMDAQLDNVLLRMFGGDVVFFPAQSCSYS